MIHCLQERRVDADAGSSLLDAELMMMTGRVSLTFSCFMDGATNQSS